MNPVLQRKRIPNRSPESVFIRKGIIPKGLDEARAKRLGTRFLSREWYREETKRKLAGEERRPLPTMAQRLHGGRLPIADIQPFQEQISYGLAQFAAHLPAGKRAVVAAQVKKLMTGRMMNINAAIREKINPDLKQMRSSGKEFLQSIKDGDNLYIALMQDKSGKVFFAKGWSREKSEQGIALHETMHILQKLGVIKTDVPWAEAVRWLYCLEKGAYKVNPKIRPPTMEEFDKKAMPEKEDNALLYEAIWSYTLGDRIGQWVFQNLSGKSRWDYMRLRASGTSHAQALEKIRAVRMVA